MAGDPTGFEFRVGSGTGNGSTALNVPDGQPQEEITMKSNAIFIVDHRNQGKLPIKGISRSRSRPGP